MLKVLHIHNFALIEDAVLEFTPGFNVFTGETGAGKSILIDAFSMVLGARASADYVRQGTDAFWVQAVFDLSAAPEAQELLAQQDIESEEGMLYIRRKVNTQGKSSATINGMNVPVSLLRQLALTLVDIHGQHQHQQLLAPQAALRIVDTMGRSRTKEAFTTYSECYNRLQELQKEQQKLLSTNEKREEILATAQKIKEEIESFAPLEGEESELREKVHVLSHREKIVSCLREALSAIDGEKKSALALLTEAKGELERAADIDEALSSCAKDLTSAWLEVEDARETIKDYLESSEYDPEAYEKMQKRLDGYVKLGRKYGASVAEILACRDRADEQIDELSTINDRCARLAQEIGKVNKELMAHAAALSGERQRVAKQLTYAVTEQIRDLAMPDGKFLVSVAPLPECTATGKDAVDFLLTANLGMEPQPLTKIASGGELSRVALALKAVLVDMGTVPTMVFDEIDTGVGGVVAQRMAEKIALIASKRQVFCITHLAQIAAFADNHFHIIKGAQAGTTVTHVTTLGALERRTEIMRMVGGDNVSAAAEQNAEEILAKAQEVRTKLQIGARVAGEFC